MRIPVHLDHEQWHIVFKRSITVREKGKSHKAEGLCVYNKQELWIEDELRGIDLAETLVHEAYHGLAWVFHETVTDFCCEYLALALYRGRIKPIGRQRYKWAIQRIASAPVLGLSETFVKLLARDLPSIVYNPKILERL